MAIGCLGKGKIPRLEHAGGIFSELSIPRTKKRISFFLSHLLYRIVALSLFLLLWVSPLLVVVHKGASLLFLGGVIHLLCISWIVVAVAFFCLFLFLCFLLLI